MSETSSSAWKELEALLGETHPQLLGRALREVQREQTRKNAMRILAHRDDRKVKPHLLDGEWTGLGMAANLLHLKAVEEWTNRS